MARRVALLAALFFLAGLALFWFLTIPDVVPAHALAPRTPNLENGRTIFYAGGCSSCHASKEAPTKLSGGLALKSAFGTFHVPNISSDPKDGIGGWSEAQFVTAMNKGTSPAGSHYYPALPYDSYQRMSFDDLRDLFAFLKTLPAAQGKVRDHEMPFPFNIRRLVGVWKLLFLDGKPFRPDASRSGEWNRGAYLVNGPGHCAECHSPRNFLGAIIEAQRFAGGRDPEGEGWIPNITQRGLKNWSEKDIAAMLKTGSTPDGDSVGGSMALIVANTARLSERDRAAMANYLKSLPAVEGTRPRKAE